MKNILLDDGLRFIYILCTVNTAILASVKNYSIKQMKKKKRMLNILMCFLIVAVVAVVVVYKQTYVASLCVGKINHLSFYLPE